MKEEVLNLSSVPQYNGLFRGRVMEILDRIAKLRVGVLGDGCLDIYWHADMKVSELSRETPHYNLPVVREVFSPGAAGNVAANFKELGSAKVSFCTAIGGDWRGMLLKESLRGLGIDDSFIVTDTERVTPAYCKTILHGLEDVQQEAPRIDFINTDGPFELLQRRLVAQLDLMAANVDVISTTDQLRSGVIGPTLRDRLRYWASQGKRIVVDSRDNIGKYKGVIVKPNELETLRWSYGSLKYPQPTDNEIIKAGFQLAKFAEAPCCVTLGERGALWFENGQVTLVPTIAVLPPIDIVGAGDSFTAAFLAALGTGSSGPEAAAFAHLAAAVSVRKLGRAGTASPQEILNRFDENESLQQTSEPC